MKKYSFVYIFSLFVLSSCIERQPAAPAHSAPVRTAPVAAAGGATAGASTAMPTGDFTYVRNPVQGMMANLGLTSDQAKQLHELRSKYVTQMAAFPKLANGRFDLEKVKPVMDRMNSEIKNFLGAQKFKRYQKYTVWNNQQNASRNG